MKEITLEISNLHVNKWYHILGLVELVVDCYC